MEKRIIVNEIETHYTINENGEVINLKTKKKLKGSYTREGYHYIRLSIDNQKFRFYTHRKVAELFVSGYKDGYIVNHKNGNKADNRAVNLEWISQSENVKHAHDNNLITKTERKALLYEGDLSEEEWKKIENYPDYQISNKGRVLSLKRKKPALLRPSIVNGYLQVALSNNGIAKNFPIHYLVYETFTRDIVDKKIYCIDHIDNNSQNNILSNLRKVTFSENVKMGIVDQKAHKEIKEVIAYKDEKEIGRYPSCKEAARQLNLDASSISKCCRGIYAHTHGYTFKYNN